MTAHSTQRRSESAGHGGTSAWYTIVGVVKEIRDRGVVEELKPTIYLVHEQADQAMGEPSGIVAEK